MFQYKPFHSLIVIIYLLIIAVNFASSDAQVMYATSRQIAFQRTVALSEHDHLPQIYRGHDQRWYSQYDPGLPLLAAPLVWLSDRLGASQQWHRYNFSAYVVRWMSAGLAALAVFTIFRMARQIYGQEPIALIVAIAAGLCSPLLVYARMFFAEAALAGFLTLAFWHGYRQRWFWSGAALGLAILIRAAMVIYLLPLLWLMMRSELLDHDRHTGLSLRQIVTRWFSLKIGRFLIFPALAVLGLMYHNYLRNADPLVFGYGEQSFNTPVYVGIAGLLFSPGKSLFLYAPPLLLSLIGARRFYRREPALAEALFMALIVALLFYGSWWAWHGGWCWGPRLLVPLIPALMLPMGEVLTMDRHAGLSLQRKIQVSAILLVGFLVSLAGALTDVNKYYALHESYDMVNYDVGASPLVGAVRDGLAGENLIRLAAFHLTEYGWAKSGAAAFPIALMVILIGSVLGLLKEFAREQ